MQISCVLKADEVCPIPSTAKELILFPEGVDQIEVEQAVACYPTAIVAGAVTEDTRNRGFLLDEGRNRIDYLKIGCDGRTSGGSPPIRLPVYETAAACIGLVICMDVETPFGREVVERVRSNRSSVKVLCIPADMGAYWFGNNRVSRTYVGLHVALCNHTKTHQERCKSFVTDTDGFKIACQSNTEPLRVDLNATKQ